MISFSPVFSPGLYFGARFAAFTNSMEHLSPCGTAQPGNLSKKQGRIEIFKNLHSRKLASLFFYSLKFRKFQKEELLFSFFIFSQNFMKRGKFSFFLKKNFNKQNFFVPMLEIFHSENFFIMVEKQKQKKLWCLFSRISRKQVKEKFFFEFVFLIKTFQNKMNFKNS